MPAPVLLIAYAFPPSPEPGALRPARFCKYLPDYGYRPVVLTSARPDAVEKGIVAIETVVKPKFSVEGFVDRCLTRYVIGADQGELRWVLDAVKKARELHRQTGFTAVFSTFPPLGTHLAALRLKRTLGVKWIADFRDPLVGNPYRGLRWSSARAERWIERQVFQYADAVVANTDAVLERWKQRYPHYAAKMHLIWNGFDPAEGVRAEPLPQRERRVLGHFGAIYGERHPRRLLESLQRLIQAGEVDPAKVQILQQGTIEGPFAAYAGAREELARLGAWVENTNIVPKQQAQKMQCELDSLLLLDTPGERPSQVPSKLFEYVQVGRPILAWTIKDAPVDRLLAESGIPGARIYYNAPEHEVDDKLRAFLKLPTDPVPMAESFAEKFDGRRQTGQLARILDQARDSV